MKNGIPPELLPYTGPEHQPFKLGDGQGGALLIHGFPGTPAEVLGAGKALAERGWTTNGILLPGFGSQLPQLELYGRKDWLENARNSWRELQLTHQPVILLGYSMGGAIALHLAAELKVDYLILVAPFWRFPGMLPYLMPFAERIMPRLRPFKKANFGDPRVREQFARILPEADLDDPAVSEVIREEFVLPVRPIREVIKLGADAYRKAGLIKAPTLVIQGKADVLVQPKQTRKLVQRLPKDRTRYCEIEGEHDLLSECCEKKDTVLRIMDEFLGKAAGG